MAKKSKKKVVGKTDFSDAKVMIFDEYGKAHIVSKAEAEKPKKAEAKAEAK